MTRGARQGAEGFGSWQTAAGDRKAQLRRLVRTQLKGYALAEDQPADVVDVEDTSMKTQKGPSVAALANKFLGERIADGAADAAETFAEVDESRTTFRVRPSRGGAAKTADLKDGRASIVQG